MGLVEEEGTMEQVCVPFPTSGTCLELHQIIPVARAFLVAVVVGLGQWLLEYSWWQWL